MIFYLTELGYSLQPIWDAMKTWSENYKELVQKG
ncbi:MAG: hypothetical protein ACLVBU_02980 [Hominisplanchenecus sp.]|uniref:Winged helix-turn-helix transcriptional regulator n=1 Tax=Faecalicatena fissicatena TaxID=290055 RepID=A0ABX2H2B9_9FIRM|nr:hypothetical protein [Ruminococcus sp. MCC718]MCB5868482.1 winged helix-turn-helix transcriptional regulator [Faecalicatena fissicatena]NSD83739.1 winged helix-turn-helix transcriptional regulator [Faecalicatena fissicatena]NSE56263.1 winged helix-turn-helix transcriptional regulator [Faecalicatena fissicatena]NSE65065.1 winged helix-turn-helix transcriptional regulator [Faecalicatena fissicatena]